MAYDRIDPFGGVRGDIQAAIIARTVASPHTKKKLKISDFIIDFDAPPKKAKTAAEMWKQAVMFTKAVKGKIN